MLQKISGSPLLADGPPDLGWPSASRAWATVFVLMTAYAVAFVDRQILTLLIEPLRRDLAITDTQFSLLSGLAFTLFYTVMGVPLAWVADRGSRRNLIMISVAVWTAMTAACGLASSFISLFAARIGVGIGEAGLSPAAYSMIGDSFPPARRARAMGVYAMGSIAGVGMALIIGGAVVEWANSAPPIVLPMIGALKSWQVAFMIVSLPGPVLVLAMALLREPKRQGLGAAAHAPSAPLAPFFRERWLAFTLLAVGYSLVGVVIAAYLTWAPAFLIRNYGWQVGKVGAVFGAILLVGSTSGILIGGWWADRFAAAGRKDAVLRVAVIGAIAGFPFAVAAPFAPTGELAAASLALMCLGFGLTQGLPAVSFQAISPNRLRARVMAIYLLIGNIVAFTVGPTAVALISDLWLKDPKKIGVAVAIVTAVVLPIGIAALVAAIRPYVRAVDEEMIAAA
ncbi:MAG: MFS transporter [Pseudomonadota bacterium]|uniref:spinster family MFS transporter n=1 Tax=Phenylobacterium sp. TaxID=1871053 RepID=UPI0025DAA610|nr:MFS transporter [Phenylobacterium sp.]MBT9469862.1 MFS transporter [Phenylobacterium sp.]